MRGNLLFRIFIIELVSSTLKVVCVTIERLSGLSTTSALAYLHLELNI